MCSKDIIRRLVKYVSVLGHFWYFLGLKSVLCLVRVFMRLIAFFTILKIAREIFITSYDTSGTGDARESDTETHLSKFFFL